MGTSKNVTLNLEKMTVSDIVSENYNAATIFKQYGLDFCCGGGITLKKACQDRNLDYDNILNQLQQLFNHKANGNFNYHAWEADYLIDYIIESHHQFVRNKTEELTPYLNKIARVHGQSNPNNVELLHKFNDLTAELLQHMEAEETVVFPLIKKIYQKRKVGKSVTPEEMDQLQNQLDLMIDDHNNAGLLMSQIRELTQNYSTHPDACTTYKMVFANLEAFEEDLHKHVHLENNILFKKASDMLPE